MSRLGLEDTYPQGRSSRPDPEACKYPARLKTLLSDRPDQIWASDMIEVSEKREFVDLVAILVQTGRCVIAWFVSASLDVELRLDQGIHLRSPAPVYRKRRMLNSCWTSTRQDHIGTCQQLISRGECTHPYEFQHGQGRCPLGLYALRRKG